MPSDCPRSKSDTQRMVGRVYRTSAGMLTSDSELSAARAHAGQSNAHPVFGFFREVGGTTLESSLLTLLAPKFESLLSVESREIMDDIESISIFCRCRANWGERQESVLQWPKKY